MKTYDVFLCHSTRHDADTATENTMAMVYVLLKDQGVRLFWDRKSLSAGEPLIPTLSKAISASRSAQDRITGYAATAVRRTLSRTVISSSTALPLNSPSGHPPRCLGRATHFTVSASVVAVRGSAPFSGAHTSHQWGTPRDGTFGRSSTRDGPYRCSSQSRAPT